MPKKPINWGIKVWMLADAKTGFTHNFKVYLGKCGNGNSCREVGLATSVVLDLAEPYNNTNSHIFFDNFYTSVALVEALLRHGLFAYGTLRANRYPPALKANDRSEDKERGNAAISEGQYGYYLVARQKADSCTVLQLQPK